MNRYKRLVKTTVEIYTDGACIRNGQSGASMGIGVHWPDAPDRNISEPYHSSKATNQRAELEAVRQGIEQCKKYGHHKVTVYTDSRYVQDGMTAWMPNWEKSGYKGVVNADGFKDLKDTMKGIDVEFKHVPSEKNLADRLAKDGAKKAATQIKHLPQAK